MLLIIFCISLNIITLYNIDTVIKFSAPGGAQDANDWVTKIRHIIWNESRRAEEIEVITL